MGQKEFIFFEQNETPPSLYIIKNYLNPNNFNSPYHGFIGNSAAINKLIRLNTIALQRFNHRSNDLNLAFIGKSGVGKTELVRRYTKANGLPLIEIYPKAIKFIHDIFLSIEKICDKEEISLYSEDDNYVLPPINIFIDEVHALSSNLIPSLLKATESKDAILVTEKGIVLDCSFVHWIIATTDRGLLFDAFDTRFSKISLNMYSKTEIASIINQNFPSWPQEACNLVAFYSSRIPREALAFAKEMDIEKKLSNKSWIDIAQQVAFDNDIDEFGMSKKRLNILRVLEEGALSAKKLAIRINVKVEELENYIIPWLLEGVDGEEPLVSVSTKGYILTEAGTKELEKRI